MNEPTTIRSRMEGHPSPSMYSYVQGRLTMKGVQVPPPDAFAAEPTVTARVETGRWILDCPFCYSAELGDPDDPRFYCLGCGNGKAGGLWLHVEYPPYDVDAEGRAG